MKQWVMKTNYRYVQGQDITGTENNKVDKVDTYLHGRAVS